MFEFLAAHAGVIAALLLAPTVVAILTARWESVSLWLQSAWHSLPLIGGIASLARRHAPRQGSDGSNAETSAIMALCGSYARFIRVLNRGDYDNYMNYLRKAGDLGRRPFPWFLWFVIFSMVIVEAAGLAYVLAGWTLPGASEVVQQLTAVGIGFLIAVILVFFTHWAGVEIYQSKQYRRDRSEWTAAGREGPLYGPDLSLNDNQRVDDAEPAFRQRATRGHGKTTYFLTTVTIFMVLTIGGGAAYVRGQVLEQELVFEASSKARAIERFELTLPAAKGGGRSAVEKQAIQDEIQIKRRGGWGTLVVLVIIFVFLQLLGMFFGYRYSFNGRLSRDAYRALKADRFSSYSELLQYYDRIADVAQSRVERLQQRFEQRQRHSLGVSAHRAEYSFRDYLQMRDAQRRDKPLGGEQETSAFSTPMPVRTTHDVPAAQTSDADAAPVVATATPHEIAAPEPVVQDRTFTPLAQTASVLDSIRPSSNAGEPHVAPNGTQATADDANSARAWLEQAEKIERERAIERARVRAKPPTKPRGAARTESEAG